jgi:hypothetical protein
LVNVYRHTPYLTHNLKKRKYGRNCDIPSPSATGWLWTF